MYISRVCGSLLNKTHKRLRGILQNTERARLLEPCTMIPKQCEFEPEFSVLVEAGSSPAGSFYDTHKVKWMQQLSIKFVNEYRTVIRTIIHSVLFIAYTVWFSFAVRHDLHEAQGTIVVTSLVASYLVYAWTRDHFGAKIYRAVCLPIGRLWDKHWQVIKWFVYAGTILGIALYLVLCVITTARQLQSLAGMVLFFAVPWITSKHPGKVKWRPVIWGMVLQFLIGCLVLRWSVGYKFVQFLADEFSKFLGYSIKGGAKIFGDPHMFRHPFAMVVVPLMIYIGCVMAILYYWGTVQWVAEKIGWLMSVTLQTTSIESVSLAVNIFLSVLDVILMLKHYLHLLTPSEFHCFLVAAHSTIAGFAFGLFVLFGVSPQHLLTGAVMSAPAAVAFSKLNFPETEVSAFRSGEPLKLSKGEDITSIDAAIRGAWDAGLSVATILIQTLAFLSMFFFLDAITSWFFAMVGFETDIASLLGYMFMPFAFMMGVDWEDTLEVGRLIGLKVTANEFLGYFELGTLNYSGGISKRSAAIATYAMCGFSSFGTMVIFSGVWQTVDPSRTVQVLTQIPRIMMNANLSCFMSACLASILYSEDIDIVDSDQSTPAAFVQIAADYRPDIDEIQDALRRVINYEQ